MASCLEFFLGKTNEHKNTEDPDILIIEYIDTKIKKINNKVKKIKTLIEETKNEIEDAEEYKNEIDKYECIDCEFTQRQKSKMIKHLKTDKHRKSKNLPLLEKEHRCDGCKITFASKDSYQKHLLSDSHLLPKEERNKKISENSKKTVEIGDKSENFIEKIYNETKEFKVDPVGFTGNTFDLILHDSNNLMRGVQVKTLSYNKIKKVYRLSLGNGDYKPDTLIIGVNIPDKIFVLFYYGQVNTGSIDFNPESKRSKYTKYIYTEETFRKNLIEMTKKSTIIKDVTKFLSESNLQEYLSLKRLNEFCLNTGNVFKRNKTNGTVIDCYINNFKIQHKSCSHKGKKQPYSEDDGIDFFVFEIVNKTHKGNFFIIPIKKLIEKGFIKTETQNGHITINLPRKAVWNLVGFEHWIIDYLNKHQPLKN